MGKVRNFILLSGLLLGLGYIVMNYSPAGPKFRRAYSNCRTGVEKLARFVRKGVGKYLVQLDTGNVGEEASGEAETPIETFEEPVSKAAPPTRNSRPKSEVLPSVDVRFLRLHAEADRAWVRQVLSDAVRAGKDEVDCLVPELSRNYEFVLNPLRAARAAGAEVRLAFCRPTATGTIRSYQALNINVFRVPGSRRNSRIIVRFPDKDVFTIYTDPGLRPQIALFVHLKERNGTRFYETLFQTRAPSALLSARHPRQSPSRLQPVRVVVSSESDIHRLFLNAVASARKSVRCIGLTRISTKLAGRLAQLGLKGVQVECLVDPFGPELDTRLTDRLRDCGVRFLLNNTRHQFAFRSVTVDGKQVLATSSDLFSQGNAAEIGELIRIYDERVCQHFDRAFQSAAE